MLYFDLTRSLSTEANHLSFSKLSNCLLLWYKYLLEAASLHRNKNCNCRQLVVPFPGVTESIFFSAEWMSSPRVWPVNGNKASISSENVSLIGKRTQTTSWAMSVRSVNSSNARLKSAAVSMSFNNCDKILSEITSTLLITVESETCNFKNCLMMSSLFWKPEKSELTQSANVVLRNSPSVAGLLILAIFQAISNEASVTLSLLLTILRKMDCWTWNPSSNAWGFVLRRSLSGG